MSRKQAVKCAVDLGMTLLLPLLMAYALVGEAAHEWLGMAMFGLFLLHHALNIHWLKQLSHGRYSGFRLLQTVLAALILLTMLGTMVSGIVMSRHVFGSLHLRTAWAQELHLCSAYWGFLLMSLHLGLHGAMLLGILRRLCSVTPSPRRTAVLRCAAVGISGLGIAIFVQNRLTDYLFLRTHFVLLDFDVTLPRFLAESLCIMWLFVCIGYALGSLVKKAERTKPFRKDIEP